MYTKKSILVAIFSFLILVILIIFGTYHYIFIKQQELLNSIYNSTNSNILKLTQNSLENKKNTTLSLALSLGEDDKLRQYMYEKNYSEFNYQKIVEQMKDYTKFKNIWIQIIDKNGNSIYRSWTDKKGDNLSFRKDLKSFIEDKKISTSISVGLFSLTMKARSPIIDKENNFLGAIEVISHFNSIASDLKEYNIDTIVITDKKYKDLIKFPYTNIFVEDYYIANINANEELIKYLQKNKVEKYFKLDNFIIENEYLISKYELFNERNEKLGYILNFIKIKEIDTQIVESLKIQIIMTSLIALIIILFSFLFYLYNSYLKQLKIQENKKQSILDSQQNIIVITNGNTIIDANQRLYDFLKI